MSSESNFYIQVDQQISAQRDLDNLYRERELTQDQEEKEKRDLIVSKLGEIEAKVKIRVDSLSKSDTHFNKDNLHGEFERAMVLHSNIIEDIFILQHTVDQMNVLRNSMVGLIHHNLKFRNSYKLKSAKEMETYIAKDADYNRVNSRIKRIEALKEKSSNFSGLIRQKIGFIRDMTKMRTQEMFGGKD